MRKGNAPTNEVFRDLGQVVELAPTAPQEHPTHGDAGKQRRQPRQVLRHAARPVDEPTDEEFHERSGCQFVSRRPYRLPAAIFAGSRHGPVRPNSYCTVSATSGPAGRYPWLT